MLELDGPHELSIGGYHLPQAGCGGAGSPVTLHCTGLVSLIIGPILLCENHSCPATTISCAKIMPSRMNKVADSCTAILEVPVDLGWTLNPQHWVILGCLRQA